MKPNVRFADGVDETTRLLLADAQTNGGLLAAVDPAAAAGLLSALNGAGVGAVEIGEVLAGDPATMEVLE